MTMRRVETLVVGAGQAGLAVSRCLAERGADHVVVERGRVAERWRTARWDSLRLITPNWMSRLPGWSYPGPDPGGYMSAPELVSYLQSYADLRRAGITTVIWTTGYRPAYPWLRVPVLDRHGEIDHRRGVTRVPGLYVLGLRFLHRRNSSFVDGVGPDARFVAAHLTRRTPSAVP